MTRYDFLLCELLHCIGHIRTDIEYSRFKSKESAEYTLKYMEELIENYRNQQKTEEDE